MSSFDWKKTIEEEETIKKEESDEEDTDNFEYKKKILNVSTEQSTQQSTGPSHCQENIEDFKDGLIITNVTAKTAVIFYALRVIAVGQPKALLTSTAGHVCYLFLCNMI